MSAPVPHPLVSVVVPFLDAGGFLREAIESVRAQTYDRWELMLVDDGSTDESRDVARAAAEREPDRIRYVQHPGGALDCSCIVPGSGKTSPWGPASPCGTGRT